MISISYITITDFHCKQIKLKNQLLITIFKKKSFEERP